MQAASCRQCSALGPTRLHAITTSRHVGVESKEWRLSFWRGCKAQTHLRDLVAQLLHRPCACVGMRIVDPAVIMYPPSQQSQGKACLELWLVLTGAYAHKFAETRGGRESDRGKAVRKGNALHKYARWASRRRASRSPHRRLLPPRKQQRACRSAARQQRSAQQSLSCGHRVWDFRQPAPPPPPLLVCRL